MNKPCYLCDIDGTLADVTHRLHHIQKKPKDWPAFFDACCDDSPIKHMVDLVSRLRLLHYVVFVSGRPERTRTATLQWLRKHKINISIEEPELYMRADGDFRDDTIIKLELLERIKADGWKPVMAFDDRSRVVAAWRSVGISCAQVAEGEF